MLAIRAHFDGSVIVPDEPVSLPPQAQVTVLVNSTESPSMDELERLTREYYQGQSQTRDEFDADDWGRGVAHDLPYAWQEE